MNQLNRRISTVLYVDDEETAHKYFVRALSADCKVLTAASADAAIKILKDAGNQVDVLVTDYRMPGRDGRDLLQQTAVDYPHLVRILVTAYADKDMLLATVNSCDIFRILEKPLALAHVRSTLRQACELVQERRASQNKLMAIDETLAFLAHELNTPLATIVNFALGIERRIAAGSALPRQQAEIENAIAAMHGNARYCLSVLSTFLDSVRHAKMPTRDAGCTARQLIASLLDIYPLSPEQRALIRIDVREDFQIATHPNCVGLVVSSLLSNALRALQEQAAPSLCFTVSVDGNPQIRISDNGPGIAPELLQRLLADPVTTHADTGGSGRGMIFCNRIMQSFGGSLLIDSDPGRQTTVTLNFPANKSS